MFRLSLHRIGLQSLCNKITVTNSSKFNELFKLNLFVTRPCTTSLPPSLHVYEPDYLDKLTPEIPLYDIVNVQIKGFDFPVLESFQKFVHKVASSLDIDGDDSWAIPAKKLEITRVEPNSSIVDSTYKLQIYERNVQIMDVPSNMMSIFIEAIQAGLPEGVNIEVHVHTDEHDNIRYVPDLELRELEKQLEEMGGPRDVKPPKRK